MSTRHSKYIKIVRWSEDDQCYIGTCPGLMFGGVHGDNEIEVYRELCKVVTEWEAYERRHRRGKRKNRGRVSANQ